MKLRKVIIPIVLALFSPFGMKGQEYRFELGLSGGMSAYMGEANTDKPLMDPNLSYGLMGRYNLSGNMALKAQLDVVGISGEVGEPADGYFKGENIGFKRNLTDFSFMFELGFSNYGVPSYMPGSSWICPYLTVGLGVTGYQSDKKKVIPHIPFGAGVKMKALPRLNVGCEWLFNKTLADDLDYAKGSTGFQLDNSWTGTKVWNKNKDWYSVLMLYVTLDLWGTSSECYR